MKTSLNKISKQLPVIALLFMALVTLSPSFAQSGFQTGQYYNSQYYIKDVPVGYPYTKYDYYGRAIGLFQVWQKAVWHSESGGSYVLVWNGAIWVNQWVNGNYYWYEWVDYERRVG